ncbi:MAG: hypothetical protein HQK50_02055 [Oligoflexia bacterium]|nr:hypothetical protein [Oligoflexia bacterium]MBF0364322.1 hypothetical protein [Oligoflexia bacterium]
MNVKEALQFLETAAANGDEEVENILSSEYQNLRKAIMKSAPHIAWDKIKQAKDTSMDYTVDTAKRIDQCVHERPWCYIGGVSLFTFALGLFLGKSTSCKSPR